MTHANSWQPPSELPTLAGSSGAGCTCCSGRKDVAHSFSKLRWDLNHIATVGRKEPFHIRVQLSRKRRKKKNLISHSILNFGCSGAEENDEQVDSKSCAGEILCASQTFMLK